MLFYCQTDAGLCAGDVLFGGESCRARVAQVAEHLYAQPFERPFADAAGRHRHVGDNRTDASFTDALVEAFHCIGIYTQQIFHLKVGCGVDGVQQGPLLSEGNMGVLELPLDGSETANHDVLSGFDGFSLLRRCIGLVIAAGGNHGAVPCVRLRIADDNHRKHVHFFGVECFEGGQMDFLFFSSGLPHVAHGGLRRTSFLQEQLLQAVELPVAAFAFGVVHGGDKVGRGCGDDAALYAFPRCEQVAQRNHAEVVSHRCPQQCRRLLEGADARQRFNFDLAVPFALHLVDERRHAIYSGIARADDAHSLALFGQLKGLFGTGTLAFHAGVHTYGLGTQIRGYKLEVVLVAYHCVGLL